MLKENTIPRSYYEVYLLNLLKEENNPKSQDEDFINTRCEKASVTFENARLEGKTVEQAQEMAIEALVKDLFC